ncbi:hypothetical protein O181_002342 [Austropuccinia psidii MF-1]|uniref:Uncharacterized protein n=1 Tax=Austropuccinia psidii MF-1 TaxID=1389203 RepID=A0A9Q3GDV9_9BASI|nr:hypothetical protein [Austropuccinia psidii MF-1]
MSGLMSGINSLTEKVQMLQLDLESREKINPELSWAPENQPSNPVQRKFWEDPLSVHFSINPKHVTLALNGKNYVTWVKAFRTTMQLIFNIPLASMDSFFPTITANDSCSVNSVLLQTIDNSTKNSIEKNHQLWLQSSLQSRNTSTYSCVLIS